MGNVVFHQLRLSEVLLRYPQLCFDGYHQVALAPILIKWLLVQHVADAASSSSFSLDQLPLLTSLWEGGQVGRNSSSTI